MIKIKSFNIGQADCFLIRIFDNNKSFNLMVDCGQVGMSKNLSAELGTQRLNGIVVTHIDDDHIRGVVDIIENVAVNKLMKNTFIIYNKYDESLINYETGRKLLEEIAKKFSQKLLVKSYAKNYHRENKIIDRRSQINDLPVKILSKSQRILMNKTTGEKGTVYITLLSPDIITLKKFMRKWNNLTTDPLLTNKSSVTFLLEYNGVNILMLGDAIVKDVLEEIKKIKSIDRIDYIKLSHHGAEKSNAGIEEFIDDYLCKEFSVTIPQNQSYTNQQHPSRNLLKVLIDKKCNIYTSTDYECLNPKDLVLSIIKKSEIEL